MPDLHHPLWCKVVSGGLLRPEVSSARYDDVTEPGYTHCHRNSQSVVTYNNPVITSDAPIQKFWADTDVSNLTLADTNIFQYYQPNEYSQSKQAVTITAE